MRKILTTIAAAALTAAAAVALAAPASALYRPDTMLQGDTLAYPAIGVGAPPSSLTSANGAWVAQLAGHDLYVAAIATGLVSWNSGPGAQNVNAPTTLALQSDGNVVMRNKNGVALWATYTTIANGGPAVTLVMQDDGNLVARNGSGTAIWSSSYGLTPSHARTPGAPAEIHAPR